MKIDFLKLLELRQSDRGYLGRVVENDKIERILEAARLAPSACNAQPWKFIVVDQPELLKEMSKAVSNWITGINAFAKEAPLMIVIVEEKANLSSRFGAKVKNKYFPLIDIGIVAEHICLAATSEGLGSCMLGWFNEADIKKLLQIPKSKRVPLIITMGYPSKPTRKKIRKPTDDIISWNQY